MEILLVAFLITLAQIPGVIFRYVPFNDKIDKAKRKELTVLYLLVVIIQFIVIYYLGTFLDATTRILSFKIILLAGETVYTLINWAVIKDKLTKHLFVAGVIGVFTLALHSLVAMVHIYITGLSPELQVMLQCIIWLTLAGIFSPQMYKLVKNVISPFFKTSNNYWSNIWPIPTIILISNLVATMNASWINTWKQFASRLLDGIIIGILCKCVAYSYKKTKESSTIKERLNSANRQLEMQQLYYSELKEHFESLKRAKHDLKFYKRGIQNYIKDNNREKLLEYFSDSKIGEIADVEMFFSGNGAVDSIIYYYFCLAKNEKINMNINCKLPNKLGISDADLCVLLGNSLANAIEACRRIKESDRFINIKADLDGGDLVIVVDNSFDGTIVKKNEEFISIKTDGAGGVGIKSMKSICEKYNGVCKFETEERVFMASFILSN